MSAFSGTVALPGIGDMKKAHVAAAVGATAGLVGFMYVRRARDSASADPAAGQDPTAEEGDYNAGADPYANPGLDAYANPAPAVVQQYEPPDPDLMPPTTNAAWTDRAVSKLTEVGYDARAVAAALGRYLGRQAPASALEVEIIRTSLAMVGPPPSGTYSILAVPAKTATSPTVVAKPPATSTSPTPTATATKTATGLYVTVRRWRRVNPPWQSTVSGIAHHYHRTATHVWNHPKNAALRARRRHMSAVQPGDRVYVVPRSV